MRSKETGIGLLGKCVGCTFTMQKSNKSRSGSIVMPSNSEEHAKVELRKKPKLEVMPRTPGSRNMEFGAQGQIPRLLPETER